MSAMQRTGFEHNKETCTTICKTTCLSATNEEEIDIFERAEKSPTKTTLRRQLDNECNV
jgi:hypothetical protein